MSHILFSYELFKVPSLGLESEGDGVDGKSWSQHFAEVFVIWLLARHRCLLTYE